MSLDHKIDAGIFLGMLGASAVAAVNPQASEEIVIQVTCVIGGLIGGWCGAWLLPVKGIDLRVRWSINMGCAVIFGPFLTVWARGRYEFLQAFTASQLAMVAAGLIGVAGVVVLQQAIPALLARYGMGRRKNKRDGSED